MKKPSVDFNADGPDFINKLSLAAASSTNNDEAKSGKGAGKMFWNFASSLRKMVTKRLGKSSSSAMEFDNSPTKTPKKVNFA